MAATSGHADATAARWCFRALSTVTEVTTNAPELARHLELLLGSFPETTGPAALSYRLQVDPDPVLWLGDSALQRRSRPVDLLAAFEVDLLRRTVALDLARWLLHAAGVAIRGRALVLGGPSGAGKTTLTTALLERGARYLSDECVALDAAGALGYARPLTFVEGSSPKRISQDFVWGSFPVVRSDDSVVVHRFLRVPGTRVVDGPVAMGALVVLRHAPTQPPRLTRISAADALLSLWPETRVRSPVALRTAQGVLASVPSYRLVTRDVDRACADLLTIVDGRREHVL